MSPEEDEREDVDDDCDDENVDEEDENEDEEEGDDEDEEEIEEEAEVCCVSFCESTVTYHCNGKPFCSSHWHDYMDYGKDDFDFDD